MASSNMMCTKFMKTRKGVQAMLRLCFGNAVILVLLVGEINEVRSLNGLSCHEVHTKVPRRSVYRLPYNNYHHPGMVQ
jgi:hypothetical protein